MNFLAFYDKIVLQNKHLKELPMKSGIVVLKKEDVAVETDSVEGFLWDEREKQR